MSALWQVTVRDAATDWVDLEVLFSHPDAGPFPEDPVFALCLLTGPAYQFDASWNRVPCCPLGMEMPWEKSYQPFDVAPRVDQFIRRVLIYKACNLPWDEDAAHRRVDQQVLATGIDRNNENWNDVWHDHWRSFWADKNNLPWAMYRVWTTDPKWLEHMTPGITYDTAAYSPNGLYVDERREVPIADSESQRRRG